MSLAALVLLFAAHAGDCDAKALQAEVAAASPSGIPAVYQKLVACDPVAAKATAPAAFSRMLAGDAANPAALAAIGAGAGDPVRDWITKLEPDHRSATIAWLGKQCADNAPVEGFFLDTQAALGAKFFEDRWFRGLADCRTPKIQAFLGEALKAEAVPRPGRDQARFFGLLQVFARNLGAAAIPTLVELAGKITDPEELTYIVNAFADAANVGAVGGIDTAAAGKAVAALEQLGPTLPPKAVDQARTTLLALGAESAADAFAQHRWRDRMVDGKYTWAAVAVEKVTCKNAKKQAYFHSGTFTEPGKVWPEDLKARFVDELTNQWGVTGAADCKGTGDVVWSFSPEPTDAASRDAWIADQKKAFTSGATGLDKVEETSHPVIAL